MLEEGKGRHTPKDLTCSTYTEKNEEAAPPSKSTGRLGTDASTSWGGGVNAAWKGYSLL